MREKKYIVQASYVRGKDDEDTITTELTEKFALSKDPKIIAMVEHLLEIKMMEKFGHDRISGWWAKPKEKT